MKQTPRAPGDPDPARARALGELDRARAPLFAEMRDLARDPGYREVDPPHLDCLHPRNQMRISPLEAESIAEALRKRPELRRRLPAIRRRLREELRRLEDSTRRQSFSCPLLERKLCLVHGAAKPIGCLAWNPGREFSDAGWFAFARRDELNDAQHPGWKLRVIPLWLARVLGEPLPARRPKRRP